MLKNAFVDIQAAAWKILHKNTNSEVQPVTDYVLKMRQKVPGWSECAWEGYPAIQSLPDA